MPLLNSYILVLHIREGTNDIYVSGFSDYMGTIEMILKNANRGGSKRKELLSKGALISAHIYKRNRLYLSDFAILERYYLRFNSVVELDLFDTILLTIQKGVIEPDFKLFKKVISDLKIAEGEGDLAKLLIFITQYLGIIDWEQFRCQFCGHIKLSGLTDYNGTTICSSCVIDMSERHNVANVVEFNLGTYRSLVDYIREALGYNTDNMLIKLTNLLEKYGEDSRNRNNL